MMDVSKYRTRYPPREHEEAVRLLLEGLDKPAVPTSSSTDLREQQVSGNSGDKMTKQYTEDGRVNDQNSRNNRMNSVNNNNNMHNSIHRNHREQHQQQQSSISSSSVDSGSLARFHPNEDELEADDIDQLGRHHRHQTYIERHDELDHELEFNSEESSSQDRIQVSPKITRNRFQSDNKLANRRLMEQQELVSNGTTSMPVKMRSKATSTTSDSISTTSGAGNLHRQLDARSIDGGDLSGNYEAIPSRTIAIQCDLKLSSVKRDGYLLDSASSDLASMQASSISSTRYGFYRLNPEMLEQRRRLARSISSRNIAHQHESSSEDGTQRPIKLNRTDVPVDEHETPAWGASMSSSLSCSSLSAPNNHRPKAVVAGDNEGDYGDEFVRELELARSKKFDGALILDSSCAETRRRPSAANVDDSEERDLQELASEQRRAAASKVAARNKLEQRFFKQHQQNDAPSHTRARDSLPKRPKTALSYVSTSRLRGQRHNDADGLISDRSLSDVDMDHDDDHDHVGDRQQPGSPALLDMQSRNRAMSQQVLFTANTAMPQSGPVNDGRATTRGSTLLDDRLNRKVDSISSNSESDLGAAERYRVPEELVVTRRGKQVSAVRGARQYTGSTGQLSRRSHTLTGGIGRESFDYGRVAAGSANDDNRMNGTSRARDNVYSSGPKQSQPGKLLEGQRLQRYTDKAGVDQFEATLPAGSGTGRRSEDDDRPKLTRFSSLSLSRGQRPASADRSCNLNNDQVRRTLISGGANRQRVQTTMGATASQSSVQSDQIDHQAADSDQKLQHRQRYLSRLAPPSGSRGAILSRKDRSSSQQALATGVRNANEGATPEISTSSVVRNPRQLAGDNRSDSLSSSRVTAPAPSAGPIGRSTSMKHMSKSGSNAARLLSPTSNRVRQAPAVDHRRPRLHDSSSTDYDSTCCDPAVQQHDGARAVGANDGPDDDDYNDRSAAPVQPMKSASSQRGPGTRPMRSESEDSESPLTRTWANPGLTTRVSSDRQPAAVDRRQGDDDASGYIAAEDRSFPELDRHQTGANYDKPATRRTVRSHSMRDVANSAGYEQPMSNYSATNGQYHLNPLVSTSNGTKSLARKRFESIYRAGQDDDLRYQSEGTSEELYSASSLDDEGQQQHQQRQVESLNNQQAPTHNHQPLDYESQLRLNEIGLPDPGTELAATTSRRHMASSHLGLAPGFAAMSRYATTGRRQLTSGHREYHPLSQHHPQGPAITGRAMSQQSLSRPTMPLSRRLRRSGGGGTSGGSQSGAGSDVGGSSMSLVSRLRYENAHTRTPVVMYIPQAMPKSASSDHLKRPLTRGGGTLSRRSTRRQSPSSKMREAASLSQDRNRKSVSRNGSDSESSSSMLRTLIKPRSSSRLASTSGSSGLGTRANGASGRRRYVNGTMKRDNLEDEENMDGVGQLASEIDSYKFRRRYSVPKDAKINWFSRLKQRVTSSKS